MEFEVEIKEIEEIVENVVDAIGEGKTFGSIMVALMRVTAAIVSESPDTEQVIKMFMVGLTDNVDHIKRLEKEEKENDKAGQ